MNYEHISHKAKLTVVSVSRVRIWSRAGAGLMRDEPLWLTRLNEAVMFSIDSTHYF